ncbi:MAG: Chemotaxis regulator - transmits chemoreceptor signals to flagellar motor components CheY, partial [uncultured Gemmatimonadaceae bacterium]
EPHGTDLRRRHLHAHDGGRHPAAGGVRHRRRGRDRAAGGGEVQAAQARPGDDGHRDARHGRH